MCFRINLWKGCSVLLLKYLTYHVISDYIQRNYFFLQSDLWTEWVVIRHLSACGCGLWLPRDGESSVIHVTVLLFHEQQVFRHAHSHLRLIRLTPLSIDEPEPRFCSSHIVHQAALWPWHPLCSVSTSLQLVEHVKNEIERWRPDFNARFAGCRKSVIGRNASIHYFLCCLLWCCFCLSMEF